MLFGLNAPNLILIGKVDVNVFVLQSNISEVGDESFIYNTFWLLLKSNCAKFPINDGDSIDAVKVLEKQLNTSTLIVFEFIK